MRRLLSYVLTILNFGMFLLVFAVTRDLYQRIFVFFYRLGTEREISGFRMSALLRTIDMVSLFVMGLVVIVLIILIQAAYERASSMAQLSGRFAFVLGLQLVWIGASRVAAWLIPSGLGVLSLDLYTFVPLAAGGTAVIAGILLKRRVSASRNT